MAVTISLVGCGNQEKPESSDPSKVALPDSAALSQVQKSDSPRIASVDSAVLIAPEDSILDEGGSGWAVLPNGDSVKRIGGAMMNAPAPKAHGYDVYMKNSTRYLRIQRLVGNKPDGNPIWQMRARLRLPPMDSREVVTEGVCSVNGKWDVSILAITGTVGDSVDFHARHAWRFDRATETLRAIPTAGVTCAHPDGDPD
jgi:hypothetical protein